MRRHKALPGPGDRVRLAIPLPSDTSTAPARYGTVLEHSCGQSNALRVRWDREGGPAELAPDAGAESWLADAGWYWDKAHLEVIGSRDTGGGVPQAESGALPREVATEEDAWLSASPLVGAEAGTGMSGGVDGSLDAVAEWEAELASEIGADADASWEDVLAAALRHGAPAAPPRQSRPVPAAPAPAARPAAATPPPPLPDAAAPPPPASTPARRWPELPAHKDIRRRAPSPDARVGDEPEPVPAAAPVLTPVQGWKGDDILPAPRASPKRWGRR